MCAGSDDATSYCDATVCPMDDLVRDHGERAEALFDALTSASSSKDAAVILSFADIHVLRRLEERYGLPESPDEDALRTRLAAEAYRRAKHGGTMRDTSKVTADVVRRWALDTVEAWLPGYTDYDEQLGGQCRLTLVGYAGAEEESGLVLEVSTADRHADPRRFIVAVGAAAVGAEPAAVADTRRTVVEDAIADFPWHNFGIEDMPLEEREWVSELAGAILTRLVAASGVVA